MAQSGIPGMAYPTQKAMLAGNPRDSAIAAQNASVQKQTALNNAVGGKKRKMRRGGASQQTQPATTIVVPQYSMQYSPQGGPGQDPNAIIAQNASIGTQGSANAVYDNEATKAGGGARRSKKNKKGGNCNLSWGCYSGGKKSRKYKKHTRKHKKSKRSKM